RWSRLKNRDPATMFEIVSEHVFPFLRNMAEAGTAHATHMKGARFTIPTPALLAKVVDLLAEIPMEDRDTKGDLYEYMLSKIATAGQNGQFRTPRHIIALMVEMMAPGPKEVIVDPACGTCGFTGASVARVCRLPDAYSGGRVNQHVSIIRPDVTRLNPHFLEHLLRAPEAKSALLRTAGAGATREAITKTQIEEFKIPLPPLEEQRRIAAILDKADMLRRKRK